MSENSHVFDYVTKGIRTVFLANPTLVGLAVGGIHLEEAPAGTRYPYIVVTLDDSKWRTFTEEFSKSKVEFWIESETSQVSECMSLMAAVESAYDNVKFADGLFSTISFINQGSSLVKVNRRWNGNVRYEANFARMDTSISTSSSTSVSQSTSTSSSYSSSVSTSNSVSASESPSRSLSFSLSISVSRSTSASTSSSISTSNSASVYELPVWESVG